LSNLDNEDEDDDINNGKAEKMQEMKNHLRYKYVN